MNRRQSEAGQTLVETALVLPMMIFFVLGVVQLGMLHQAKLMTEYAAYRAARAGVVNSGDCDKMFDSAWVVLLPTMEKRVDTLTRLALRKQLTMRKYGLGVLDKVKIEVLSPKKSDIGTLFSRYGSHMDGKEIDWDDVRDPTVIAGNLLSVRVTYNYSLRIPFANWMLHGWFMGAEYLKYVKGLQFESPEFGTGPLKVGGIAHATLEAKGAMRGGDFGKIAALSAFGTYVVPLVSTHTMRMQSNLFKDRVEKCAVNQ